MKKANTQPVDPNMLFPRRYRRSMSLTFFLCVLLTFLVTVLTPPIVRSVSVIALPVGLTASQNIQHLTIVDTAAIKPPDSVPLKTFNFKAMPADSGSAVILSVEAEGNYFDVVPKVADAWAEAAIARLGPGTTMVQPADPAVVVRPRKVQYLLVGTFFGALAAFYLATWCEVFRQLEIRERLLGEPLAIANSQRRTQRRARRQTAPRYRTPWKRCERIVRVSAVYGFLITLLITIFTEPTFESEALIQLPQGVRVSQIRGQLAAYASDVPHSSMPNFPTRNEIKPVGEDSPEIVALAVLGGTQQPEAYSRMADAWAATAVAHLGTDAHVLTHAEPATVAVKPKKVQNIVTGTCLGFIVGIFIALFTEAKRLIWPRRLSAPIAADSVIVADDILRSEA